MIDYFKALKGNTPDHIRRNDNMRYFVAKRAFLKHTKSFYPKTAKKRVKIAEKKDGFLGFIYGSKVILI